jgi:hypothetical protein
MRQYCVEFEQALQSDNYSPIVLNNEQEYKALLKEIPSYRRGQENVGWKELTE